MSAKTLSEKTLLLSALACCATLILGPTRGAAQPPVRTLSSELAAGADWRSYSQMKLFQEPIDFNNVDKSRLNAACYHETNARRVSHGFKALAYHERLESIAQIYAEVMVRDNFFAHHHPTNSSLRTTEDRGLAAGIQNPKIAENIAITIGIPYESGAPVYPRGQGQFSHSPDGPIIQAHTYASFAKEVLDQWMNSPGHRQNILSKDAVALGCGASFFWQDGFPAFKAVQNFQFFIPIKLNAAIAAPSPATNRPATTEQQATAQLPPKLLDPIKQSRQRQVAAATPKPKAKTEVMTTRRGNRIIKKTVITREIEGGTEVEEIIEITTVQ